ncbi:porin [Thiothrix eikelboomii]|uniref:Outer membrane protein (Porin) n=1 Tax=Thiothrix eikelboomii TaxID=92487 RepID=A0A1T4WQA8_9GAMM|nr:porin [Thiothrix eikelboomii]SKA79550.1 Outer membrane protein (porin) [Thiothrix eikelboomii]
MKLKNLTIAIAMASLAATSFAAQAEDGTSFYGSVRVGINSTDNGVASTTQIQNWYSRMGFKAETEVADGLKGFGHYEFGVDTDSADNANGALSTRKAYVGLKGGFGRVRLGQDYHTFYNAVIAPMDIAWDSGGTGASALGTYTGRTGEALSYDTTFGQIGLAATMYQGDDTYNDGYEVGATFGAGPVKVGVAYKDADFSGAAEDTSKAYGVSLGGKLGPAEYGFAYTDRDNTGNSIDLHLGYAGAYLAYGQADLDSGAKPTSVSVGYTLPIGKKTSAWFEAQQSDNDLGAKDSEVTKLKAALKYDF